MEYFYIHRIYIQKCKLTRNTKIIPNDASLMLCELRTKLKVGKKKTINIINMNCDLKKPKLSLSHNICYILLSIKPSFVIRCASKPTIMSGQLKKYFFNFV